MKYLFALLSLAVATYASPIFGSSSPVQLNGDIKADSPLGQKLMANARRLDDNAAVSYTWVADFSLKFQGCHHMAQWNNAVDGEDDVRIQTKRLIRFRLCPTTSCKATNTMGCNSGYGDYVIDMSTYLEAYSQAVTNYNEYRCENLKNNVCACQDSDNEESCLYDCYKSHGGLESICSEDAVQVADYLDCARYNPNNNNDVKYFLGPYCAAQGGSIYIGLFTDDTCTSFADENGGRTTFETLSGGEAMPFSDSNLINVDCIPCKEPTDGSAGENDAADSDEVTETCEGLYRMAGKCETKLSSSSTKNTNACNYMQGIKITRKNGSVSQQSSPANKTASVFIGIFVASFVLLCAYVYYLKTKLARASINLSE